MTIRCGWVCRILAMAMRWGILPKSYQYDPVGNIVQMIHTAATGGWTRRYTHDSGSNRLLSTSLPGDTPDGPFSAKYNYDAHGSMTTMPHLSLLELDFKDQLCHVNLGGGGDAYYNYDSGSQRVRKVWEKSPGFIEERIYLGGFEIYRRKNGNGDITLERETLHVVDGNRVIALVETKTIDMNGPCPDVTKRFGSLPI